MASTVAQKQQLEQPLRELENAFNIMRANIELANTVESGFAPPQRMLRTFSILYTWDQTAALCIIGENEVRIVTEIAPYLKASIDDTRVEASWPVAKEFEGLATDVCVEFCNSRGLLGVLRRYLNQARVVFSNRAHLSAELDFFRDEEIEDSTHVVLRVEVNSDQEAALEEYDRWVRWVVANIPPSHSQFFTLTVRRV
jgi:hypothetical protein